MIATLKTSSCLLLPTFLSYWNILIVDDRTIDHWNICIVWALHSTGSFDVLQIKLQLFVKITNDSDAGPYMRSQSHLELMINQNEFEHKLTNIDGVTHFQEIYPAWSSVIFNFFYNFFLQRRLLESIESPFYFLWPPKKMNAKIFLQIKMLIARIILKN